MNKIKAFAREKCKKNDMIHDIHHMERTVKIAKHLAKSEGADVDICEAAAWLHDIAQGTHKAEHEVVGAKMARNFLKKIIKDKEVVERIAHAVNCHNTRSVHLAKTKEDLISYDSDRLEVIGPLGFCREFAYQVANEKGKLTDAVAKAKYYNTSRYNKLKTKTAKQLAKKPHRLMTEFHKIFDKQEKVNFK